MKDNNFLFDYDAKKAKKIQEIARKYTEVLSDNYEEIKMLDKEAEKPAKFWFLIIFIGGILTFGCGLSLILAYNLLYVGSIIGLAGIAVIIFSFKLKNKILKKRKKEYGPKILALVNDNK